MIRWNHALAEHLACNPDTNDRENGELARHLLALVERSAREGMPAIREELQDLAAAWQERDGGFLSSGVDLVFDNLGAQALENCLMAMIVSSGSRGVAFRRQCLVTTALVGLLAVEPRFTRIQMEAWFWRAPQLENRPSEREIGRAHV